jgi:16S rRNA processing protein RimM
VAAARRLRADEWFVWQLQGLRAVTPDHESIGVVEDVEPGVANDVLVVRSGAGVRRFPMVRAFVQQVDVAAGVITLTPLPEDDA